MSQNNNSQRLKLALAGVAAVAVAAGSGIAWFSSQSPEAAVQLPIDSPVEQSIRADGDEPTKTQPDGTDLDSAENPAPTGDTLASSGDANAPGAARPNSGATGDRSGPSVYWIGADGNEVQYDAQRIAVAPNAGAETQLRTAMGELLAGGDATAIPKGTELLGAEVKGQDVYVDLSREFTQGGGSSAMAARLGQIIYTATAVEPGAQVWISVEGEPLTELGGEGLIINQPLDVAKFEEDFNF